MKTYEELDVEWHKALDAIYHYIVELECLPKCDYSYETEQELRREYNQKLEEFRTKLSDIEKQQEELRKESLTVTTSKIDNLKEHYEKL